jgi:hypothetical protein
LPDVIAGEHGVRRHALIAVLTGITRANNVYARIDRHVGAKAVVTGGCPTAGRVGIAATTLVGAAAVIAGDSHEIAGEGSIRADADRAVPTTVTRPSVVLDAAAESVDTGGVATASLVEATAAPDIGAAVERPV